ncbi:MAG TPA: GNAT family N-acetyltransferase, partial [Thermomicrobiales bacterium]|nr:GNAT family N-acetyltransferase [Thermomicrobiales bacterium]
MTPRIDRAYNGVGDLRRMQAAIGAAASTGLRIGDLAWLARGQTHRHLALDIRLWESDEGQLVGWTFVRANGSFNIFVAPGHADAEFVDEMLDVVDDAARAAVAAGDHVGSLFTFGIDPTRSVEDRALAEGLERRGFVAAPGTGGFLRRDLAEIPDPVLPAGYRLAAVETPGQVRGRVETHRAVFDPSELTLGAYERVRRTWPYRAGLDRIVETDDGAVTAFCTAWIDAEHARGYLEPVGTHPAHRGQGLARAVCFSALAALRSAGADMVEVAFTSDAALALYRSL